MISVREASLCGKGECRDIRDVHALSVSVVAHKPWQGDGLAGAVAGSLTH